MIVAPFKKTVILNFPCTGSVAPAHALDRAYGKDIREVGGHHALPPLHWMELSELGFDETWNVITTIRHPYTWFWSAFKKGWGDARSRRQFDVQWVRHVQRDGRWMDRYQRRLFSKWTQYATHVWKQETLAKEAKRYFPEVELVQENVSTDWGWTDVDSAPIDTIMYIFSWYKKDLFVYYDQDYAFNL